MKKEFIFISVLALIIIALMVLKPIYGWQLRALLAPPPINWEIESSARMENEKLKAELAVLQNVKAQLPERPEKSIRAIVYSRYPLNFKNELLVNVGVNENVLKGKAVMFGGMIIGKVSEVFEETALIETAFDDRFQLPVRIGRNGVQALFKGGSLPALELISPTAELQMGDIVYSAAADFPYGVPMGEVKDIRISDDNLFQTAVLDIPYDIGGINTVFIAE